jgi:thiol-disulfide isomerase/thioredoxin
MTQSKGLWTAIPVAAVLLFASCGLVPRGRLVGKPAPNFQVQGAYGGTIDLASLRGRPALLVFWATSCGICRRELPMLSRLATEFGPSVQFVGVNLGDRQGARDILRSMKLTNTVDQTGEAARSYGVSGTPKLVLIGRDGNILHENEGAKPEAVLRQWLQSAEGG